MLQSEGGEGVGKCIMGGRRAEVKGHLYGLFGPHESHHKYTACTHMYAHTCMRATHASTYMQYIKGEKPVGI